LARWTACTRAHVRLVRYSRCQAHVRRAPFLLHTPLAQRSTFPSGARARVLCVAALACLAAPPLICPSVRPSPCRCCQPSASTRCRVCSCVSLSLSFSRGRRPIHLWFGCSIGPRRLSLVVSLFRCCLPHSLVRALSLSSAASDRSPSLIDRSTARVIAWISRPPTSPITAVRPTPPLPSRSLRRPRRPPLPCRCSPVSSSSRRRRRP